MKLAALALCTALALAALAALGLAQDKPKTGEKLVRCTVCQNEGRVPCPEHEKSLAQYEDDVVYCSEIADCKVCGGTGWLDCKDCDNPKWAAALVKKQSQIGSVQAPALAKYDKELGRKLRKCATEHFELVWEIDELKIDKRMVQHHELMHIYARRLERLYADYMAAFHANPRELRDRAEVLVWWLPKDQQDASNRFAGQSSPRGIKLLGQDSVYCVCGNKQNFQGDEELHRNVIHNVAHLLLAHQTPSLWIGNIKGGWADEGVAHWFEDRYFGVCDNFCYQEQNTNITYKEGKWKPAVRKMVASGDVPPVGEVMSKNTDGLEPPMHAVAFSYVDYLLTLDGAKFNSLCRQLRQKVAARDALQSSFGLGPLEFEAKWKAWVLETYPTR